MKKKIHVSPEKLAANRANAKRSTGPKTLAGKAKASQNSYKHGFHSLHLFLPEQVAEDGAAYEMFLKGLRDFYSPKGFMEQVVVEEIAALHLRRARLEKYENVFIEKNRIRVFENPVIANLGRSETTATRRIQQATERLEALQEKRFAEEAALGFEDGDEGDAAGTVAPCPDPPATPSSEAAESAEIHDPGEEVLEASL